MMNKEKMSLVEKIDFLNDICEKSLSFMADSGGWYLHSYRDGTPFYGSPWLQAESLEEVVDKAIQKWSKIRRSYESISSSTVLSRGTGTRRS